MKRLLMIPVLAALLITAGCGGDGAGGSAPIPGNTIDTSSNAPGSGGAAPTPTDGSSPAPSNGPGSGG